LLNLFSIIGCVAHDYDPAIALRWNPFIRFNVVVALLLLCRTAFATRFLFPFIIIGPLLLLVRIAVGIPLLFWYYYLVNWLMGCCILTFVN
jgi:hypothetical protein